MFSVGVVMRSNSDSNMMKDAVQILRQFDVSCLEKIIPDHAVSLIPWVKEFEEQGGKVVIIETKEDASFVKEVGTVSALPIILVPVAIDMTLGSSVATVAINGSRNAALLAIAILALADDRLRAELKVFRTKLKEEVERKNQILQQKIYSFS